MKLTRIIFAGLCLFLAACQGISVEVSEGNSFHEANYSTYAWLDSAVTKPTSGDDKLFILDSILRNTLQAQLTSKGYRLTSAEEADFLISYVYFTQLAAEDASSTGKVVRQNERWMVTVNFDDQGYYDDSVASTIASERANLQLEFQDRTGNIVWQAVARRAIERQYADKKHYQSLIGKTISKMFGNLPDIGLN